MARLMINVMVQLTVTAAAYQVMVPMMAQVLVLHLPVLTVLRRVIAVLVSRLVCMMPH